MPYLTPETIPTDTQCGMLVIPADSAIIAAVNGALLELIEPGNWELFGSITPEEIAAAMQTMVFAFFDSQCDAGVGMNSEITLSPLNCLVAAGNALTRVANSTQLDSVYYHQSPAVNNQIIGANRFMAKGDWAFRLVGWKAADSGILELTIYEGGVYSAFSGTSDFYNATNSANHYYTGVFTITHDGLYTIQFKTTGKHASSSAYLQRITIFEAWRTGDI